MMSEMVIGLTLEEAYKLSPKTIDEKLGVAQTQVPLFGVGGQSSQSRY